MEEINKMKLDSDHDRPEQQSQPGQPQEQPAAPYWQNNPSEPPNLASQDTTPAENRQAYVPYYGSSPTPYSQPSVASNPNASAQNHSYGVGAIPQTEAQSTQRTPFIVGGSIAAFVLASAAFFVGGEPGKFMEIGLQFAPFVVLALLAFGGLRNSVASVFTYVWMGLLAFLILGLDMVLVLGAFIQDSNSAVLSERFKPGLGSALLWAMLLLMVTSLVSLSMLLRPVRVAVARIVPVDPDNFVHKIALCMLTLFMLSSFVPLIVLGGNPPFLQLVDTISSQEGAAGGTDLSARPIDLIYQLVWTIPIALVGAGWPIVRKFRETLVRLGFVRPTLNQVVAGVGLGVGLALLANFVIDPAITEFWRMMGWATTDAESFEKLLAGVKSIPGAILIGVTAGVGEELSVRGLLQPRIGLIFSNLVFTSFHAFQYSFDGLLSVFIIGLILGIIRSRSNTSTSAIVHGVYDFVLVTMWVILSGS